MNLLVIRIIKKNVAEWLQGSRQNFVARMDAETPSDRIYRLGLTASQSMQASSDYSYNQGMRIRLQDSVLFFNGSGSDL